MRIFLQTSVPLLLLIGLGYLSRRFALLRQGDERVLSAYVYFFALPALFFVSMAETVFTREVVLFVVTGALPVLAVFLLLLAIFIIARISREHFSLLVLCTVFGSYAFFGIPFVMFAFPSGDITQLATVAAAGISSVSVIIAIIILEIQKMSRLKRPSFAKGCRDVTAKLAINPLVISIFLGTAVSLLGIKMPVSATRLLHMLGDTTATVAIFMLGVFFYGKRYSRLGLAFGLSLFRMVLMPLIALAVVRIMGMNERDSAIIVMMNAMPLAISMLVLSERYDFYKETIASVILITSLLAGLYLNIWLAILGFNHP